MNCIASFIVSIVFFCITFKTNSQSGFIFKNQLNHKQKISFKEINNLIVIPLKINGRKLSFILDTGVNKTILFNLSQNDSINLLNTRKLQLKGLGGGEAVNALISQKNTIEIENLVSNNETIFVVLKDFFDLSGKMGTTIHGVIGYSLFKNFIVKINYASEKIEFYKPERFSYKKCKKCVTTPLYFYNNKPFIKAAVSLDTIHNKLTDVTMLIDSGGSDALWLFENSKNEIKTPKLFFHDILGEGLSGSIFGNRSRVPEFKIGTFSIKNPTVSFLDTLSTDDARKFKDRNGSIGGGILSRFKVWIDYPNEKITFKKNHFFKKYFNYNMSGLDVIYIGKEIIRQPKVETAKNSYGTPTEDSKTISYITSYEYKFKPAYKINQVVAMSPADKAGLKANDKILFLNGKPVSDYKLADILGKFQEKDGKKIKITIERNGEKMKFEFRLEKKV